jgi:Fic family protein
LLIHPFKDANGRTSRVIYDALISKKQDDFVPLSIYRLGSKKGTYGEAIIAFNSSETAGCNNLYWRSAAKWCEEYHKQATLILLNTKSIINNKISLSPLNQFDCKILNHLWTQPVLNIAYVVKELSFPFEDTINSINKLKNLNILKQFKTKDSKEQFVFLCEDVINAWTTLDDLVFFNK